MTVSALPAALLDPAVIRREVDARLDAFMADKVRAADSLRLPAELAGMLREFLLNGGKRVRPQLCVIGWLAGGGDPAPPARVVQVAASLEMFHAFALIHDDVMDRSATRRGRPSIHRALAALHGADVNGADVPGADRIGENGAVLVGDLALVWSDELLAGAALTADQQARTRPVIDAMRAEVMYGQYLDVVAGTAPADDTERPLTVIRYKTARYTVERPLQLGAALAGGGPAVAAALTDYALPIGEAFQLRDDLLGVFGSPDETGKSSLDDLREGKHTLLLALALQRADADQRDTLHTLVGDPELDEEDATRVRAVLEATGARTAIERRIDERRAEALAALVAAPIPAAAAQALVDFADTATVRVV
ncbi:polyprenyl synthetase family protein [Kitasatospora sp. NPDC049285]|uniref:polyprenyl synthetase family protein n=1 Tax=Kitasatospora sp. NPDC049285 TaxID=3157096 RepID=UPI003413C2AF